MNIRLHPQAQKELDAVAYYEKQQPGLGDDFATEVTDSIQRILQQPNAFPLVGRRMRWCRVHRFSYGLVFTVTATELFIAAVAHTSRNFGYWARRSP